MVSSLLVSLPVLTILSVAFPFAPVGPDPVGGAEQVLSTIDARIVAEGHASIVLAVEGSRAAGHLVTIPAQRGTLDERARELVHGAYRRELTRLLREHRIDVVHLHGLDFMDYLPDTDIPRIVTLHLPAPWYPPAAFELPDVHRICVSRSQRSTCPPGTIAEVIENGVPLERYSPAPHKRDFLLALGRICPEKGFVHALRAAHALGVPLVLGGSVFPYEAHQRHLRDELVPLLDGQRRWVGAVSGATKRALLAQACCLLVTSLVDETSSLVAMEALASGTPVVGFRRGALAEIVEHGQTGWLVDTPEQLPDAIARARTLSTLACRDAARERACASRMTSRYLETFEARARARSRPRTPNLVEPELLTDDDELAALAAEWDSLCDRCPTATPFQRPAWLLAWRRWFGAGAVPRVVVLRRSGRLVGLVPLELRGDTLRLIGEGITDYLDAIIEPDVAPTQLTKPLRMAGDDARAIELAALRPCSPLLQLELGGAQIESTPSPVVVISHVRVPRRVAYERRRLARHDARWEHEDGDVQGLLAGLFELHRARWAIRGEPGVLADPAIERFHTEAATALHARGLLRMIGLHLDGRLRAVHYGFADHGRHLFYLSGFDPEVASLSPGRLLIDRALERARDDRAFEFDFLRGCEAYKYEWGAEDRPARMVRLD